MPKSLPHGVFRTVRWWTAAGTSLVVLFISLGWSLLTSLEFDEQCNQGVVDGPGRLLDIRRQTFPPAVICEYEQGDVSAGATGVLGAVVWLSVVCLTVSVLLGLLVEWTDPPTPGTTDRLVPPGTALPRVSPVEKLRRTGTAFVVATSAFFLVYGLAAWPLITGPSSACSARGEWASYPPQTLEYSLFPPQATCLYRSGATSELNPGWVEVLTTVLAVAMVIAGIGLALAWRRWRAEPHDTRSAEPRRG